jgi:hypothetical protein
MFLKITDFHDLQEIRIKIDGYEIVHEDIRDLEIHWQINEIYTVGSLKWVDSVHMIEHKPLKVNDIMDLYWKDASGETYKQKFVITEVQDVRTEIRQNIGAIRFIDQNTIEFLKTYHSKGFTHNKMDEICKFYIGKYKKDKEPKYDITKKVWGNEQGDDSNSHVVPGDRSLMNNFYRFMAEGDFIIYQDREHIVLTEWKKITSKSALDHKLKFVPENMSYMGKMGEYKSAPANGLAANIIMPDHKTVRIDHTKGKKLIKSDLDYKKARDDSGKTGATDVEWVQGNGTRVIGYSTNTSDSHDYSYKKYVNNMVLAEVIVPGWSKRNIGDIIELQMETLNINEDIDKNMSGKWVITKMIDKVAQGHFTQLLTIARSVNK